MVCRIHAAHLQTSPGDATRWRDGWLLIQMYPDRFNLEISGDQVPQEIPSVVKICSIIFFPLKPAFGFSQKSQCKAISSQRTKQHRDYKKEGKKTKPNH